MSPALAGERLDRAAAALTGLSRRRVRELAESGSVWLNAKAVRVLSRTLALGDVVDVIPPPGADLAPATATDALPLLHDDGWLVAIDKPAGALTQPGRDRDERGSVHERLTLQLAAREGVRPDVLLFHRLDRITSGVLVFARSHEAARALNEAWSAGRAHKRYLAIVNGDPGERWRRLAGPIAADRLAPGRFRVERRGRPALTEVRRLALAGDLALVEAVPRTGRTHQVRVHLADAGFPVAGDALYGGGELSRPFLHAWRLTLPHPADGSRLELEAPVPPDLQSVLADRHVDVHATLRALT